MEYKINYNNRIFRSKFNSETGEVDDQAIFHYYQEDNILKATYAGGQILEGQMLGLVHPDGKIKFNYQHINIGGNLRSGICTSTPEVLETGAILLHESWQWMDGNQECGKSVVEEVVD